MSTLFAFIKWVFVQIGKGLYKQHRHFRRGLEDETGLHIFIWFVLSLLSSLAAMLILVGIQSATGINIPVQVWFTYIAGCVVYLVYNGVSIMYNAFKAERAELFETIKNGR